jgi:hypothetical protein
MYFFYEKENLPHERVRNPPITKKIFHIGENSQILTVSNKKHYNGIILLKKVVLVEQQF